MVGAFVVYRCFTTSWQQDSDAEIPLKRIIHIFPQCIVPLKGNDQVKAFAWL
jgi:hypothetical protein